MDGGLESFKTSINLNKFAASLGYEGNSGDIILNFKKVTEPYSVRNTYLMIKR